jgi:hypothetical protein
LNTADDWLHLGLAATSLLLAVLTWNGRTPEERRP